VIRYSGTVTFRDGREEHYSGGLAAQADWEAYAVRHGLQITPTPETLTTFPVVTWRLYIAYICLGAPEGFDVWRKTVVDVEQIDEAELVPPTQPAATRA
jgi:hypothetical protein